MPPRSERSRGPKPVPDRLCLQGILFVLHTGIPWQQLPLELGFGSDGIPPVAGRVGHPRKRPDALLGDKGYDSNADRRELRRRGILPVISSRKVQPDIHGPDIHGLGRIRYVVEQIFVLLHQFMRLAVRWERRLALHDAFVSVGCSLICWRRLKRPLTSQARRSSPWPVGHSHAATGQ
uniref:Transposase n=1 Tax=Streptomyces flaveolus TaxID=67297 RepID=D3UA03_9ACTN|nr:transposase [Streptomyces flaveolus]